MIKKLRIKRIGNSIINYIENGSSILDIGCGNCALGIYLKSQKSISYYGVDIIDFKTTDKEINFTKSFLPYPFKDKSFDYILLILTLHHFENPEEGLKEAIRLARKKIFILEDVPRNIIENNLMKLVDFIGNRIISKEIPLPFNFYYDKEWHNIFKRYNLKLLNKTKVYPFPFPKLNHFLYEVTL